jgi:hypothetical protein
MAIEAAGKNKRASAMRRESSKAMQQVKRSAKNAVKDSVSTFRIMTTV